MGAGAASFWGPAFTNPFTEERGHSHEYLFFSTLGGEYRFAERLGLSGGIGLGYLVQRAAVLPVRDRYETVPTLELGLHYYF